MVNALCLWVEVYGRDAAGGVVDTLGADGILEGVHTEQAGNLFLSISICTTGQGNVKLNPWVSV